MGSFVNSNLTPSLPKKNLLSTASTALTHLMDSSQILEIKLMTTLAALHATSLRAAMQVRI